MKLSKKRLKQIIEEEITQMKRTNEVYAGASMGAAPRRPRLGGDWAAGRGTPVTDAAVAALEGIETPEDLFRALAAEHNVTLGADEPVPEEDPLDAPIQP
jgi:hypothetical protein